MAERILPINTCGECKHYSFQKSWFNENGKYDSIYTCQLTGETVDSSGDVPPDWCPLTRGPVYQIKPLEWQETIKAKEWKAQFGSGAYRIYVVVGHWYWEEPEYWEVHTPDGSRCESLEAGKAACEADHYARIVAALIEVRS